MLLVLLLVLLPPPTISQVRSFERLLTVDADGVLPAVERGMGDPRSPQWEWQELRSSLGWRASPGRWTRELEAWQQHDPTPWPWAVAALHGERPQREQALRTALDIDPSFLPALRLEVQLAIEEGQLERASTLLQPLMQRAPDDPYLLDLQGQIALAEGHAQTAAALFTEVTQRQPQRVSGWIRRLRAQMAQQQWGDVETALQQLRFLAPLRAETLTCSAQVARQRQLWEQLLERCDLGLEHFPETLSLVLWKCEAWAALERWDDLENTLQSYEQLWHREPASFARFRCRLSWERKDVDGLRQAMSSLKALQSPRNASGDSPSDSSEYLRFEGRLASLEGREDDLLRIASDLPQDPELAQLARVVSRARQRSQSRIVFLSIIAIGAVLALAAAIALRKRSTDNPTPDSRE